MMARLRVGAILICLVFVSLVLIPVQMAVLRKGGALKRLLPRIWHRAAAGLMGMRVNVSGTPATGRPLLIVANHQSWADIVALGSAFELSFIAKSEVRGWPVFGWLARLQRTVFVERQARGQTARQTDAIAARLNAGDAMVLFAEGTTSDGNGILPFKTALFGAAQASLRGSDRAEVLVQPVAIAYTRVHGMPLGRYFRPLAAWPGDVELVPHLMAFLREGAFDVEISFGEPLIFTAGSDRKAVAAACERQVARLLSRSLCDTSQSMPATTP